MPARSFLHFRNFFKSEGVGRLVPAESFLQFRIFSKSEGIERLVPAKSFLQFRIFSKSEGIGSLCLLDYSFNSEAFSYSFNSEAFSNLKVSTGLCPPAYMELFVKSPPLCPTHNGKIMRPDPLAQDPGRKRKEKKGLLERLFGWL